MARKKSPQKQYQESLRVLKRRLDVSHKDAQKIYRLQRSKSDAPIPPSKFRGYAKSTLQKFKRQARKLAPPPKHKRKKRRVTGAGPRVRTLFEGDIASFMLRHQSDVMPQRAREMIVRVRPFWVGAKPQQPIEVKRDNVAAEDFWRTYHDAVRSALNTATGKQGESPQAVFTEFLGVTDLPGFADDAIEDLYPEYF